MSWQKQLNGDSLSWLLEPETPGVCYLALRDLLERPKTDPELVAACRAAHEDGPISIVLNHMDQEGFWAKPGPGYTTKYRSTVWSLLLLAQLGASVTEDERIGLGCKYLLDHTLTEAGQFSTSGAPSGTIDCLQGNLAWALLELGYDDPRLEKAFDWIARSVTGEGVGSLDDRSSALRYYYFKSGPNFACGINHQLPCAWGCVKLMLAMGKWPEERRTPLLNRAIQQGIDLLFSIDPVRAAYPTRNGAKPSTNWWKFGFPVFYITDLLQLAQALVSLGVGNDPRLANVLTLIDEKQDENGRWQLGFDYPGKSWLDFGVKKQPNKWVTLRALKVLKATGSF